MRGRRRARFGLTLALLSAAALIAPRLSARPPTVAVGEVSVKSAGADAATELVLRELVQREIGRLRLDEGRRDAAFVFSASLVRLEARDDANGAEATCVVSGTLRRAGSGVLVALLQGRGAAEDERGARDSARVHAMEAAVAGAVRRLPEAL
ncbi:MAG TPA: hypothetical protein VHE30_23410 [Polyangiaceae bacterium]|nr:hypothetical protein [Polyangiaceae bacterium]